MDIENSLQLEHDKKKFEFHPKRFLKQLQQKLYQSPALYLIFCFIVPVAFMYIIYLAMGIYPFADTSPLVLDLNAQYVHFFTALRQSIYGDASLLYSFARSLGGEFMGIYAYYLASPFTYIVALFPIERMQEAVLCILLLKTGLCGLSMGYYLHKRSKNPNRLIVLTFSLLYSLCAYAVVQQNNTMWIDAMILLPLFVYGLENLIVNKRYKLYVLTLCAILITNYYIGYMMCIFAVLYFFYYYFSKSKDEINPAKEKLHFIRTGARFAFFSILSAAISAFMLIAAYYSLRFGKSAFSNPNWSLQGNFSILDFLTKFLPGSFDTVEPSGLPFVYCGLVSLFLVPAYFVAKKISTREKIASIALISVFLLSLIVAPIDLIWHGFSAPNWLNARYSFMFCFVLLIIAYKGFASIRQAGEKFIIGIGAILLLLVAFAEKSSFKSFINSKEKLLVFGCIWFSVFFIVALAVLLCLRIRVKTPKTSKSVCAVLAAVISLELLCNGIVCFIQFDKDVSFATYSSYSNFFSEFRPLVNKIKEYDSGFYRMEKVRHRTKNDNMALGIKGITNSTSTLNASAINFVNQLGYTGRSHLTMYKGGTPFSDSLLGIKYVIDYKSSQRYEHTYTQLTQIGSKNYKVMQNPYAMSLAYGVDSDVSALELDNYANFFERYNGIITAMLGDESTIELFKPMYDVTSATTDCTVTESSSTAQYVTSEKTTGTLIFSYVAPYTGEYYFYTPPMSKIEKLSVDFYCREDIEALDRTKVTSVSSYLESDSNHILAAGYYESGSIIEIEFKIPKDSDLKIDKSSAFLWYLDSDIYDASMTALLKKPQFNIAPESKEHNLKGTIKTTESSQMILTTIPYDKGWSVFIDGQKVETYQTMDALMAFDISSSGEHSVEMKYMPSCYIVGAIISSFGILAFITLCILDLVFKKTLLKNKPIKYVHEYWELDDLEDDRLSLTVALTDNKLEPTEEETADIEENVPEQSEDIENTENPEQPNDAQNA